MKKMQKRVNSLSKQVKNVPGVAADVKKLKGTMTALEGAKKKNDKQGARKILKKMAGTLKNLETEIARQGKEKKIPHAGAPKKQAMQVSGPGKSSSKTDNFLNEIEKAQSLEGLGKVFERANFSQAELREIQQQVKIPPYSKKLQRLVEKEGSSTKSEMKARSRQVIKQKEREFQQRQEQELRQLNNQASAKLQGLKAKSKVSMSTLVKRSNAIFRGPMESQMTMAGEGSTADIHSVNPAEAVVGGSLTLSGVDFGTSEGRVAIVIGTDMVYCSISSWEQRRIDVTVPDDLQDIVGESEKEGFVWVKLHGGERGPTWDLTIRPDYSRMTPEITSLSSEEIEPDQDLIIEGRNFLTEQSGEVKFAFGDLEVNGRVNEWHDTYISVTLPGITGLTGTVGTVTVINHIPSSDVESITFVPRLHSQTLVRTHLGKTCLFFGFGREFTDYDFELQNGWKVAENYVEWQGRSVLSLGCEFVTQAVPGSTHAYSRILVWCDLIGYIYSYNYLRLEGPEGVSAGYD